MNEEENLKSIYEPIKEMQIIKNYLILANKYQSNLHVWLKGKSFYYKSKILNFDSSSINYNALPPKNMKTTEFEKIMREKGNETFFSFKLDEMIFFWKTKFINNLGTYAKFEIPDIIYKLQRRKNLRVKFVKSRPFKVYFDPPSDLQDILVKFEAYKYDDMLKLYSATFIVDQNKYVIVKDLYDLSAGGFGITLNADEARFYSEEKIIHNIQFKIGETKMNLDGEIRYKSDYKELETYVGNIKEVQHPEDLEPSGIFENTGSFSTKYKIGIMFLNVDQKDDKDIAKYVYDENRRIFSLIL